MTNDTSTLNGALQELGETMASNLQAKGVTASASDGLTTLAGKILTIPAGSCYHIEFSEDSYTAVGGSATLEIYLQENYQPKSGATVTVTGSDSSLYSGITNNEGIAQVTVSNISAETTFTATYQGVTDTCTVTVGPTILFYDPCNSTYDSSKYGIIMPVNSTSSMTNYTTYNSTENAYRTYASGDWGLIPIPDMDGLDNYKITAYFKPVGSSNHLYRGGFGWIASGTNKPFYCIRINGDKTCMYTYKPGSSENNTTLVSNLDLSVYHRIEAIKQGNSYTFKIYDTDDTTVLGTTTQTFSLSNIRIGLMLCCGSSYGCYVKNIKAEAL